MDWVCKQPFSGKHKIKDALYRDEVTLQKARAVTHGMSGVSAIKSGHEPSAETFINLQHSQRRKETANTCPKVHWSK